mgnify:CR=1 FL=1
MKKIYLDANIFLNAILYDDKKAESCKEIISQIINNKLQGYTSLLTWDEVVYTIQKLSGRKLSIKEGEKMLKVPNMVFLDVNINIILKAQRLMDRYDLYPRDSIHLSSMLINNIEELASDDSDFDKLKEIKRIKV